ncbi:AAA family ATPase [Roseivirga pacifica]|uniref:AAA family ATPase n=1 Tax=Roseivirga pacifica TaxID=1267423 RepID=UPI003BB05422
MLIEFKFRNFKSFKDETSLLMTNVKSFRELRDTNLIETNREFDLLKTSAIFGINGSGKSNFVIAMAYMTGIIHNSFSNSLKKEEERPNHNFQFKLNTTCDKAPTFFEVSFLLDESIYRYGFEIFEHTIIKEWLFRKVERETFLFERNRNDFKINNKAFPEGKKRKDEVNENVLFLSHLSQYNQKISRTVFDWFSNINTISGLRENAYEKFTTYLLEKDSNFKNWMTATLKFLEITNVDPGEEDGDIVTYHNKYDENNFLVDSVPFIARDEESAGTTKLIYLLGPIYDTLRSGRILFIDEFDNKLHPNLTKKLVELFHEINIHGAQLVFTCHDSNLLDKKLFRRDQIWFASKNQFGISELYSLSEFNAQTVRKDSAFDKKYLGNEFGAAETLDVTDELTELLYA